MILVSKILHPLNTTNRILIIVPQNSEFETGFVHWLKLIKVLSSQIGASVQFIGMENTVDHIRAYIESSRLNLEAKYLFTETLDSELIPLKDVDPDDLLTIISARKGTISYQTYLDSLPKTLSKRFNERSFIIVYPDQNLDQIEYH